MRLVPPPNIRHQAEDIIAKSRAELAQHSRNHAAFNREIQRARQILAESRDLLRRIETVLTSAPGRL